MLKAGVSGFCSYKDTLTTVLLLLHLLDLSLCIRRNVFEEKYFASIQRWELWVWTAPRSSGLQAALISCLLFSNLTLSQKQIQQQHPFYKFCAKKWLFLRTLSQEMIPQEESIEHWYLSKLLWYSLQGQGRKNQAKQLFRQGIFLAAILSSGCVVSFHPDQRQRERRPGVL